LTEEYPKDPSLENFQMQGESLERDGDDDDENTAVVVGNVTREGKGLR